MSKQLATLRLVGDEYVVEREQRIEGTAAAVFERIVDFRRWPSWSPWEELDPDLWREYSGSDSGVGAVYEWAGNRKAGAGRMTITAVEPDRSVTIDLQFMKPFRSRSTSELTLSPDGATVTVRWRMTG